MDVYGVTSTADCSFPIDDLLDFSNDEIFSSSSTDSESLHHHHQHYLPTPQSQSQSQSHTDTHNNNNPSSNNRFPSQPINNHFSTDFTNDLCVPSDDVAELEWLSQFVDDSFTDFPANELAGNVVLRSDPSLSGGRARTKRSKAPTTDWTSSPETGKSKPKSKSGGDRGSPEAEGEIRRCTHCASEKTPQWRTGPMGPKTLCNACGVRYKSGRLVPEYRPASSPTFVLTQHSNSHRKVLELRRQKELFRQHQLQQQQQQQPPQQEQMYHHHHHHHRHQQDFEVC